MLKVLSEILYARYVLLYSYFGLDYFWTQNFEHDCDFTFILSFHYTCDHSLRFVWRLFDQLAIPINDLFLCGLDALIVEMYTSYLIYILFIMFIYFFALRYIFFCLLMLLTLLFVVDVIVAYFFLNSFHCSCSGSSMYFTFLSVISSLLFMLPLFVRTLFIGYHYFVFISVLIQSVRLLCFLFKLLSWLSL